MLQSVRALAEPALLQRLTLLLNHVLAAEPVAVQRLGPHAGKRLHIELVDWPSLLRWPGDDLGGSFKIPPDHHPASIPVYLNHYILYRPIKNSDEPKI